MSKDERMPRPGDADEPIEDPQGAGDEAGRPGGPAGRPASGRAADESGTPGPESEQSAAPSVGPEAQSGTEPGPPAPPTPGPERLAPSGPSPAVESPSPDVALADEASPLPGAHRGGFRRLPTAPIPVTSQTAPAEPGTEDTPPSAAAQWLMPPTDPPQRGLAAWALASSIVGLVVSLFVGWGFPIGLVGVVSAILALRRPLESRAVAVWALAIGVVSILYSAGWLFYAASIAAGSASVTG